MISIGTDIVEISRIEKSIGNEHFMNRVFTAKELEHCMCAENYAGIFAAKEAYFKAVGSGIKLPLTEIEILHDENGKPYISGIENSDLSISHDGDYAVASVVIWK